MRLAFMFAGQGAQAVGMGRDLAEASPAAKAIFEEADDILGWKLSKLCFDGPAEELTACAHCQPAIYTMSCACLAALRERRPDIAPTACGGLSLGELTALHVAGYCSFADGLKLVATRGQLMDDACQATHGGMAAVLGASTEDVEAVCAEADVDIANLNCPGQIVISGEAERIAKALEILAARNLRGVPLQVAGAYHSRLMQKASENFGSYLKKVTLTEPTARLVQNAIGAFVSPSDEILANLEKQVCSRVRWEECARALMAEAELLIELGPGNVLSGLMKRIDRSFPCVSVNSIASLEALCTKLEAN